METDHGVQVKSLSRQGSSISSSSSNRNLDESELIELSTALDVPPETSNEQSSYDNLPAEQASAGSIQNRIPSSIFNSKPATPNEWSITSNESLFSIHIGNYSCSKEQFLTLYKSGELTKLDEQIIAQGGVMPSLKELEEMEAKEDSVGNNDGHNKADIDDHSHEMKLPAEVHNFRRCSISGVSDESRLSFAFPVLNCTEGGRLSSVNFRHLCNQESKTQSVKQHPEQEQCPETPQSATGQSWFSCFSCCR